jgi:hypothetical protein
MRNFLYSAQVLNFDESRVRDLVVAQNRGGRIHAFENLHVHTPARATVFLRDLAAARTIGIYRVIAFQSMTHVN